MESKMTTSILLLIGLAACAQLTDAQEWRPPPQAKLYQQGEPTYVQTPGDGLYNHSWYIVEDRRYFVFEVKACAGVLLAFSAYMDTKEVQVIEIALGVADNSRLEIRAPSGGPVRFSTYAWDPLHCNEFRSFWVLWARDIFVVGRGPAVNSQSLMTWTDPNMDYFNAVGLTSVNGNAAVWRISENSASHQVVHSFGDHRYGNLWKSVEAKIFWTFRVRASAGNVHVLLTEKLGYVGDNVYELVIGEGLTNRSRVFLRTEVMGAADTIKTEVQYPNIIDATERREFWLCWHQGQIEFGRGALYGVNRLLLWKDPVPIAVRYLSLTSSANSFASWLFQDDQESVSYIFTYPKTSTLPEVIYNTTWITTPREEYFTAAVRACREASILISDSLTPSPGVSIEVVLGAANNTLTLARYLGRTDSLVEVATPSVLSCTEARHFWISWHNATLRVGGGYIYSLDIVLETPITSNTLDGFLAGGISLATPTTDGEWRVQESVGERIVVRTPPVFEHFNFYWRTITQQQFVVFRVRACSDCHIALSPTPYVDAAQTYYDFVISGWTNTQTQIRLVVGANRQDISAPLATPGLLKCGSHIDLWVSWSDNQIQMGRGNIATYNTLFTHNLAPGALPVKAISYSSGFNFEGDFVLDEDIGDYFMFYTGAKDGIRWLDFAPAITWFSMRLRGCDALMIHLCDDRTLANCYLVQLGTNGNTRSSIIARNVQVAESTVANLLDCMDSRFFWFRWDAPTRVLTVGQGTIPRTNLLLTYQDPNGLINIQYAGMESTEEDHNARWQVDKSSAIGVTFYTPVSFTYEQMWETVERRRGIAFGVTACSDVHVVVSNKFRWWEDVYDVVIGGWFNQRSVIRINTPYYREYAVANTPDIVSCTEQRWFWVTWQYGAIEVGRGEVLGVDKFMDYQPLQMYQVSAVGYSTGFDSEGNWYIRTSGPQPAPPTPGTPPPLIGEPSLGGLSQDQVAGLVLGILAAVLLVGIVLIYARTRNLQAAQGGGGGSFEPPNLSIGGRTGPAAEDAVTVDNLDE